MISKIIKSLVKISSIIMLFLPILLLSCTQKIGNKNATYIKTQSELKNLLKEGVQNPYTRFGLVNRIANNMLSVDDYTNLIVFLTDWVQQNPDDEYNAYWLLMVAHAYMKTDSKPIAEYYFEKALRDYRDIIANGLSVHSLCLKNLIQISTRASSRIVYFNELINSFPDNTNKTELYFRLAMEYEKEGKWDLALRTYQQFLSQDDAATIQIEGLPEAYNTAKQLIDFNNSSKDWTFDTLDDLVSAVRRALINHNGYQLDRYKSKVNFFATSWRQDESAPNAQSEIPISSYMAGHAIRCAEKVDESSSPTEAYLKTWGWNSIYVDVWYFYFRKVNFPADSKIHGTWEWAGIYYGEKL